ncbi:MAG: biotin transporter BioY [Brachybacterium alimentarium]|uniref:biotin transporter BioY n=1 Tax=Brachybacterium alimentarium TaxID=47845 RepID=UPI000BB8AC4B|nr:biotin transporter BioY [Brachybacterium alimentarium]PCC30910.1 BioY family transporter [Brachybacterium alimentarium]RCS84798.1 biotin transporter BioY [Brachybacterium alimentarium]RCS92142.1 biotin transporter BioY [Brachybacterium alimentarium]
MADRTQKQDSTDGTDGWRWSLDAQDIARVAVFAALVAALGLPGSFNVFGGVPITAQTFGVMLAGAVLGPRLGALSMIVLLALAAAGLPLLAGGRGGLSAFVGPSAGYMFGWILGAFAVGLIVHASTRKPSALRVALAAIIGGILVIYAVGIPVQSLVTRLPLEQTVLASLVFLPGDLLKAALATAVVATLLRAYPRAFRRTWQPARRSIRRADAAPAQRPR